MSKLPSNWQSVSLGQICNVEMGQSPESSTYNDEGKGLPFFQGKAEFGRFHPSVRKWCTDPKKVAEQGDILLSIRAPVGPSNIASEKCIIGRGLAALRAIEPVYQEYVFHLIRKLEPWLGQQGTGTTFKAISGEFVRSIEVPLAPNNEQKRIADKLDAVLARVDACRDRLDRIPAILKRFRQSVLAAAISGKLTEEWRSVHGNNHGEWHSVRVQEPYSHEMTAPISWTISNLGNVVDFIGGSQPPKSTFTDKDSPDVIRLIQIRDYKSDKHLTYIPRNLAKRFCSKTDVMIGRYGPPIFQILRGLQGAYNVALMKAEPKTPDLDLEYLFYFLKVDVLLKYVEAGSDRTAGQDGVRKELLFPYPIFLPPMEEQHEIVRRVETLFAYADRLEARYHAARAQVEKLTPALLAKAFRGELVPQDPSDEPASELLARIRAARPIEKPKKARQPTIRKAVRAPKENSTMTKSRQDDDVKNQPYLAGHLRLLEGTATVETLFKVSELPVADFYKQLAWEVAQGYVKDNKTALEAADAA